jgi:hypothetical protein
VFLDVPVACRVRNVGEDHLRAVDKRVIAVVNRDPHAAFAESNNVAFLAACHICDETNMCGGKPSSCILSKVPDDSGVNVVMPDNDSIETESDDVSDTGACGWS